MAQWNDFAKNEGLVPPGQQQGLSRRLRREIEEAAPSLVEVDWSEATGRWDERQLYLDAPTEPIWRFVVEAVRNCHAICAHVTQKTQNQGSYWLCQQPRFQEVLAEVCRRQLSLPADVFGVIKAHFAHEMQQPAPAAAVEQPWASPTLLAEQSDTLRELYQQLGGRKLRRMNFDRE